MMEETAHLPAHACAQEGVQLPGVDQPEQVGQPWLRPLPGHRRPLLVAGGGRLMAG